MKFDQKKLAAVGLCIQRSVDLDIDTTTSMVSKDVNVECSLIAIRTTN